MSKWAPRTLFLVMLVSIASPTHARAAAVGALLGVGRQAISGDAPPNTSYGARGGLIAGVQGEMALTPSIALCVQPSFAQRRTTLTSVDDVTGEDALDLNLDYVSVPVLLKFGAAGGRTYFAGGVDIGFLQSAHLTGDGLDRDIKDRFNSMDVGALFGFGVVFPVGRPRLTTELRYVQGLVNLSSGDFAEAAASTATSLPDRFHSGGLELMAGILFPLGKP
ncbi:MAG TPA: porin family protein [Candidatus Eisenbacteria bacterium]|nr:porin family protein [Candidatus Eisenbacteria bacterium]